MTVCLSVWLSVRLSYCLYVCLSYYLSVSQSVCLSVCLSQLWASVYYAIQLLSCIVTDYDTLHFPSVWPSLIYLSGFGSILFYSILILNFLIYPYIYFIIFYFYFFNFIDVIRERSAPHNYLMISRK